MRANHPSPPPCPSPFRPCRFSVLLGATVAIWTASSGCQTGQDTIRTSHQSQLSNSATSSQSPSPQPKITDVPPAVLGGVAIPWRDLQPFLVEAGGGIALEEFVLSRLLEKQLQIQGLEIAPEDVQAERDIFEQMLASGSGIAKENIPSMVEQVRRRRRMGPSRFASLLQRNAMLRKLVSNQAEPSEELIANALEIKYGVRYQARLILVASEKDASEVLNQLRDSSRDPSLLFLELAATISLDPSNAAAGLLEPISPADPSYPVAIRNSLKTLEVGQISRAIAVDQGYALLRLEQIIPAAALKPQDARQRITQELRIKQQRLLMDTLAQQLLDGADLKILDRSLDWSWGTRRSGRP